MRSRASLLCASVCLTACVADPAEPTTEAVAKLCGEEICGNTSKMGAFPFWELDESMQAFSEVGGFRITGLWSAGNVPMQPMVIGFRLFGRDAGGVDWPVFGGRMRVEQEGGALYELYFQPGNDTVGGLYYYEGGKQPGDLPLPTYEITYAPIVDGRRGTIRDLCSDDGTTLVRDALVYQGDRYDLIAGKVIETGFAAEPWFNIACRDDSLWKLAVMRHVEAASDANHLTSPDDRTAGLRSIRADYCGTGRPYTVPGTAVDWRNRRGWLTFDLVANPLIEAIWTSTGALCLTQPRLKALADTMTCAKAACTPAQLASWTTQASMLTRVPSPPP